MFSDIYMNCCVLFWSLKCKIFNACLHMMCSIEAHTFLQAQPHMWQYSQDPAVNSSYNMSKEHWLNDSLCSADFGHLFSFPILVMSHCYTQNVSSSRDHFQSMALPLTWQGKYNSNVFEFLSLLSSFLSYRLAFLSSVILDAILETPAWSWDLLEVLTNKALGTAEMHFLITTTFKIFIV